MPGQRTFRLLVQAAGSHAQLWLEKEQLQALTEAIARMLLEIDLERARELNVSPESAASSRPPSFPADPEIEVYVGNIGLRYDSQRDLIALEAYDRGAPEEDPPAVRCLASRRQMEMLQANSMEVIAAGRPRCPLCKTPLSAPGMPHFCPPMNGHQKLDGDEEQP